MSIDVDTIFPRHLLKIIPLFYFPKLALEKSEVVRLVVGTTNHGRQLLDSLLQADLMDEFLKESQISVDDLRRLRNSGMFWHDISRFPFPEMGDYLPAFLLLNGLNYTEVLKALYYFYVDDIFEPGGKFNVQNVKVMLKKKRLPTADMEMKLLLEGVFDDIGYVFGMSNIARHRQMLYRTFTANVLDKIEALLKQKTMEYFYKLEGVMYEKGRMWPIEDEQVTMFYREVVEEQFCICRSVFTRKGINWEKAQMNFYKSLDNYVTKEQLSRPFATSRRIDDGIEKDAKVFGVSPSLMQEIRNSPMLETYFRPHVKPSKKPTLAREHVKESAPQISLAKEAMSSIRQGRFAGAADLFKRMLVENKEKSSEHVYNLKLSRIFCLYRSSNYDELKRELKVLINNESQKEECHCLPKYCLAYYHSKQFNFNESKSLTSEINEEKFLQENFPEWPEGGGYFDVLQFNKTNSSCSAEDRKKALDQLRNPPAPDATCVFEQCNSSKREIYRNDPNSTDDYCSFVCSEKCKHEYHFPCWRKMKKECKENFDEKSLPGTNCFTDGCGGKFERITIFESNGRVKKENYFVPKVKAEEKAKKEKSKKKQKKNGFENVSSKDEDEVAKPMCSNSMSFKDIYSSSEHAMGCDEENCETKGADDKEPICSTGASVAEKPLSSLQIQSEPEVPELVSNDQLRLLRREEDDEDMNDGASKKKRRNRRQRGNSENKGLLSNTFDVLSIDETGDEKVPQNIWSKRSKNSSGSRVSSRTVSESTSGATPIEPTINANVPPYKGTVTNEERAPSKSLNREQPLYGDWDLNEVKTENDFESTRNPRNDDLPPRFDLNADSYEVEPQKSFYQEKDSTNAWKQSVCGDAPRSTLPNFAKNNSEFTNRNMNNEGGPFSGFNKDAPAPQKRGENLPSANRNTTRGRGRGFPTVSSFEEPKKTKRINANWNAPPPVQKLSFQSSATENTGADEPTGFFDKEKNEKSSHFSGTVKLDMGGNSNFETTNSAFDSSDSQSSAPKTGVFSLFNQAQGVNQGGKFKFFDSIKNLPPQAPPKSSDVARSTQFLTVNASSGNGGGAQVDSSDHFTSRVTLPNPSASDQNHASSSHPAFTKTPTSMPLQQEFENQQNVTENNMTYVQQRQAETVQQQQQCQPSPFYPEGFDHTGDQLSEQELRQLMTGGDSFMAAPRAQSVPAPRPAAAPPQNSNAFLLHPQQPAFFPHSQQAPQQHIPQFQPPFRLPVHPGNIAAPSSRMPDVIPPVVSPNIPFRASVAGVPRPVHIDSPRFQSQANFPRQPNYNLFSAFNVFHANQFQQFNH